VLTFLYLAYLKVKYPDSVFLLRGNHETRTVSRIYGFLAEIKATYVYQGLFEVFNLTFDSLPLSAVVDRRWFCVHGGICPEIIGYRRIHTIDRECCCGDGPSVATGLLWSDPDEAAADWGLNLRGAGYTFGRRQVEEFLSRNRLRGIVRSHQLADEGFRWFFDKKLALVWSAPNYTYKCDNQATVMKIKGDEEQFRFFEPDARSPDIPSACGLAEYFA
jgi:diadenosine tetraphosphatase ApaH/serine/threonine PP2A family protein phosphatase